MQLAGIGQRTAPSLEKVRLQQTGIHLTKHQIGIFRRTVGQHGFLKKANRKDTTTDRDIKRGCTPSRLGSANCGIIVP